jgi:phosphoenolpyruvate carboxylase
VVARAYSHFLSLANAAEQKHKAHAPDRALFPDGPPGQALIQASISSLLAQGHTKDQVFRQVRTCC